MGKEGRIVVNAIVNTVFDGLWAPFQRIDPIYGLIAFSLLTGALMVGVFRTVSNQRGIRRAKCLVQGYLLELRLYGHDLRLTGSAIGHLLIGTLKYMGHSIRPFLVMAVPVLLILGQCAMRLDRRPLRPGETAILAVQLDAPPVSLSDMAAVRALHVPEGLVVETPSLRTPAQGRIEWRIRAEKPGRYVAMVQVLDDTLEKTIWVTDRIVHLAPKRVRKSFWGVLLNPGEPPFEADTSVRAIRVGYPARTMRVFGWRMHWLMLFFGLSMAFGFMFKQFFRVEL